MPETNKIVPLRPGSNEMDQDLYLFHAGLIRKAQDEFDAVKAIHKKKIKKLRRSARDSGMSLKWFDLLTKIFAAQGDETPDNQVQDITKYAAFEGVSLQLEFELTGSKGKSAAYKRGYNDGLSGRDQASDDQKYLDGWGDGAKKYTEFKDRFVDNEEDEVDLSAAG